MQHLQRNVLSTKTKSASDKGKILISGTICAVSRMRIRMSMRIRCTPNFDIPDEGSRKVEELSIYLKKYGKYQGYSVIFRLS